jgi:hypothetical protein
MTKRMGLLIAGLLFVFVPGLFAQEHYTEGPVWRVSLIRVKPGHMDGYLTVLQNQFKRVADEAKRQGIIVDYKVFLKETQNNPDDWAVCTALEFKNHAALDGVDAKFEEIVNKMSGGKEAAQQSLQKREDIREILSEELMQEVSLK